MKTFFLPILTAFTLTISIASAQGVGDALTIALQGDANTEQSAKLELIRILQERLNKLTVSQLNSRIIVSRGVSGYYKVDEIYKMEAEMWGFRSKYVTLANKLEDGNSGFSATSGNGFSFKYMVQYNTAVTKAKAIKNQLDVILSSGKPILLPAMPTFNISPMASDPGADVAAAMGALMSSYGVNSQSDFDNMPADKKAELQGKMEAMGQQFKESISKAIKDSNKQSLTIIGNVIGTAFGIPGAGNMIAGLFSGGGSGALAGLVGSIVDQFQIPTDYYDSNTLKLTDSERLKIIDELHMRVSELYQQTIALGANMSTEAKKRYSEISQPRNDVILYGPKK